MKSWKTLTTHVLQKIDETVGIMKQNLTSTEERGREIHTLNNKADGLHDQSSKFRNSARKVKRQMCLSNMKWWFIIAGVVALIILVSVIG